LPFWFLVRLLAAASTGMTDILQGEQVWCGVW